MRTWLRPRKNRGSRICYLGLVLCILLTTLLAGCKSEKADIKKIKDLEFTVVEYASVPEELMQMIEEKKAEPFKMTFKSDDSLYIIVGYGAKPTGGYSIAVNELYLTSNAIYIDTDLMGPEKGESVTQAITYPYIVVKLEKLAERVVFN
ncbi:protease complex subunit PrcB family protein [Anaerosporobacter faecicola]|uniref:protease complex subunit PrcB family protein n=1 Tax=Anaerosporobacter faecicola TaxID=2718714 RepID=UPI00143AE7A6|nr:protease complex subunit PrcB family protein [Anaerosporobacter faecicola]